MDFSLIFCGFLCMVVVGMLLPWWYGCGVLICGSGFWVVVLQCHGYGWVLILLGAVVMETTSVEAWRSAFDGF